MISKKLLNIFLFSIILWIAHGIEEWITKFYIIDKSYLITVGRISTSGNTFLIYQLILWLLLFLLLFFIIRGKRLVGLLGLIGIIMILELQHVYEAIIRSQYYPGLWTSLFFIPTAFLFWRELINNIKSK